MLFLLNMVAIERHILIHSEAPGDASSTLACGETLTIPVLSQNKPHKTNQPKRTPKNLPPNTTPSLSPPKKGEKKNHE